MPAAHPILGIDRKWWVVVTITPSLMLMGLNATILDIPQVVMIPELETDHFRYQWATGGSVLGSVIGMALLRWLRDRFGLKNVYIAGMLIFSLASLPCGLATGVPLLTVARFVQGLGKGMVVANVLATMWREFPEHKDLAMALYGIAIYFGKAIAPTIGAYLTDYPSWRWIFYVNVLAGLITFILSWWVLVPDKPTDAEPAPFDYLGLLFLIVWVTALLICLFRGQKWGWTHSRAWVVILAVFLTSLLAWVVREASIDYALIDLRLFKAPLFALTMTIKSIYMVNFGAVFSLLATYMVTLRQYPRTTTGLVLLPGALLMGVALLLSGLLGKPETRKWRIVVGLAGMAIATWKLAIVDLYTDKWLLSLYFALWGFSAGLVITPIICLPLGDMPQPLVVSSATIKNMVRVLPGTFGSLLIGILLTRQTDNHFDNLRQDIVYNRPIIQNVHATLVDSLGMRSSNAEVGLQADSVVRTYVHDNSTAFANQTALHWLALTSLLAMGMALFIWQPAKK